MQTRSLPDRGVNGLQERKEPRKYAHARLNRRDEQIFIGGVKAPARRTCAVDHRRTGSSDAVGVRSAACVRPLGCKTLQTCGFIHELNERAVLFGIRHCRRKRQAFGFHVNAVAAAPSRKSFDGVINRLTVFIPAASTVNRNLAELRHGVAYRAALNDADIERGAFAAVVLKLIDFEREASGGQYGRTSILRIIAGMSSDAAEHNFPDSTALARTHKGAVRAPRFADNGEPALLGKRREPSARGCRAYFLIRIVGNGNSEPMEVLGPRIFERMKNGNDAGLAVSAPRAGDALFADGERPQGGSAVRIDRVEVRIEENVIMVGIGLIDGKESSAGLAAKINKLSGKANRIEAAFHDFCGSSDAGAVAAAAVKIDDLLKIAKIVI